MNNMPVTDSDARESLQLLGWITLLVLAVFLACCVGKLIDTYYPGALDLASNRPFLFL